MPAVPSCVLELLWVQFAALIPPVEDNHPLGCHRPRVPDRIVFDKFIQVLVLGASYNKIADPVLLGDHHPHQARRVDRRGRLHCPGGHGTEGIRPGHRPGPVPT